MRARRFNQIGQNPSRNTTYDSRLIHGGMSIPPVEDANVATRQWRTTAAVLHLETRWKTPHGLWLSNAPVIAIVQNMQHALTGQWPSEQNNPILLRMVYRLLRPLTGVDLAPLRHSNTTQT